MALPFAGGRVRDTATGFPWQYPNGKSAWRCSWCGKVGPWQDGWGGYWSILQEDDGLMSDHGAGYPVWCSPECCAKVQASGACSELNVVKVTRKPRGKRP